MNQTSSSNQHNTTEPPDTSSAPSAQGDVIRVADFGAKGDGRTDDAHAIHQALIEAKSADSAVAVEFEKGKTYYIGGNGVLVGQNVFKGAIILEQARDITVNGNGSTLLLEPGQVAACIAGCKNVTMTGFKVDYAKPTYAVGTVVGRGSGYLDFTTDIEMNFGGDTVYNAPVADYFSIPYGINAAGAQTRSHQWTKKIEQIGAKKCRVYIRTGASDSAGSVGILPNGGSSADGQKWFLPNPNVGQAYGEIFFVGFNEAVTFRDIQIYSASSFVFAIKGNTGKLTFDRVNMMPKGGRTLNMVSWRDGFHCKDNSQPMLYTNCKVSGLFDDAFNISATMHYITKIVSSDTIEIKCFDLGGAYYGIDPGDEITIIDPTGSGAVKGTAKVVSASNLGNGFRLKLDKPLGSMAAVNNRLTINNRAAPGSEIRNCELEGTFRFRGKLTVTDTVFKPLVMWVMYEGHAEGPIPKDILFQSCTFNGGNIEVGCYSREFGKVLSNIAVNNIRFTGCQFNGVEKKLYEGSTVEW